MSKYGHGKEKDNVKGWKNYKDSVQVPAVTKNERVDFDVAKFDKIIEQKGVRFNVFRTSFCPRVKSVDGAEHEIDCPLCHGSGWLDRNSIQTKGVIQNQDLEKLIHREGLVDENSVAVTFKIGINLQYFTMVELIDFTDIYFQRVLRNEDGDIDVLQYNACQVNMLVDYFGVEYEQGRDFKICKGNVEWIGNKPANNVPYTISYEAPVQFRATRAIHVNRFTQFNNGAVDEHIKMPEQWILTKDYIVNKTQNVNGTERIQGKFDDHEIIED